MGHSCLHWQTHHKEVAANCALPQIPVVITFLLRHKKAAASGCSSSYQFKRDKVYKNIFALSLLHM